MSGHEKHYIPHDDLLALITAIESLETYIIILNANVVLLNENLQIMTAKDEITATGTHTTVLVNGNGTFLSEILSADYDVFLRSLVVILTNADGSPLLGHDSDVRINIDDTDGNLYLYSQLFEGNIKPMKGDASTVHSYGTTKHLNNYRLPAGNTIRVTCAYQNMRADTIFTIYLKYVVATFTT